MPTRNQAMIRRDINRLQETVNYHKDTQPALAAISGMVTDSALKVNNAQEFQAKALAGDKERAERDTAISLLLDWIQS